MQDSADKGNEPEGSGATAGNAAGPSADAEQETTGKGKKASGTQSEDGTKRTSMTAKIVSKVTGKK